MSCKFIIVLTCYSTFISVFREKWENMKLLVHFKRYQWWCLLLIYLCRHKGNQEMCHLQRVWFILPFIITLCSEGEDHSLNLWFQHQTFALWSACNVGIANIAKRERNKGAKQLDALMKVSLFVFLLCWPSSFILITERPYVCQELSVPLRTYTENFPKRRDLHPYERSLIELTFGEGYYEQV